MSVTVQVLHVISLSLTVSGGVEATHQEGDDITDQCILVLGRLHHDVNEKVLRDLGLSATADHFGHG